MFENSQEEEFASGLIFCHFGLREEGKLDLRPHPSGWGRLDPDRKFPCNNEGSRDHRHGVDRLMPFTGDHYLNF